MPLYEYECLECHRRTEKRQKFSDPEITTCPHCGGPIERVISAPAFSLKGGGWYADGYGSARKPASDSGGKENGGKEGGSKEAAAPAAGAPDSKAAPAAAPSAPAGPSSPTKS